MGDINVTCGTCFSCSAGHPNHCEKRNVIGIKGHHGVRAEYTCLPLKNLISVPDSVSDDAAVFAEPLAAALEIQTQVEIQPQHHVLVVGAGRRAKLEWRDGEMTAVMKNHKGTNSGVNIGPKQAMSTVADTHAETRPAEKRNKMLSAGLLYFLAGFNKAKSLN